MILALFLIEYILTDLSMEVKKLSGFPPDVKVCLEVEKRSPPTFRWMIAPEEEEGVAQSLSSDIFAVSKASKMDVFFVNCSNSVIYAFFRLSRFYLTG